MVISYSPTVIALVLLGAICLGSLASYLVYVILNRGKRNWKVSLLVIGILPPACSCQR